MSSLFIALCSMMVGANEADSYADAHAATMKTGRPMLVMVSTDWCVPCQRMKKTVIPQVRQRGTLSKVAFAIVNPDHDRDLAQQLTGGGPVPQLILFHKTSQGWMRQQLVGGQSVETVEQFINQAAADETSETAEPAKPQCEEAKALGEEKKTVAAAKTGD
jgi:thioredoxin-like negative regulator of GroEL